VALFNTNLLQIVKPPEGYVTSKLAPSEQLIPEFNGAPEGYSKSEMQIQTVMGDQLPFIKPEDVTHFSALLTEVDED
jgi:hypothetical protein